MVEAGARIESIGLVGLGAMGRGFAQQLRENDVRVVAWDLDPRKLTAAADDLGVERAESLRELVNALPTPRAFLIMIPPGSRIDDLVELMLPHLGDGDIIIDGGNSFYEDTTRRVRKMKKRGVRFVGMGVSGGPDGALRGAALMPSCDEETWCVIEPLLRVVAAQGADGPSIGRIGVDGAGHFVKMVHNGIELAVTQALAETYAMTRDLMGYEAEESADFFDAAGEEPFGSYFLDLASRVLRTGDGNGGDGKMIDRIGDQADTNGHGVDIVRAALELGIPVPSISAAVNARRVSFMKDHREMLSEIISPAPRAMEPNRGEELMSVLKDALHASIACIYVQGFDLIRTASTRFGWHLDLSEIARVWKNGCVVRTQLLDVFCTTCRDKPQATSLLICRHISSLISDRREAWRRCVAIAQEHEVSVPLMAASLAWFDGMRTQRLPQNLAQALRDACGRHGIEVLDDPGVLHHGEWAEETAAS